MFEVKGVNVKYKVFPENPFLMTFSKIVMIDASVVVATIALGIWKEAFVWYAVVGGVLLAWWLRQPQKNSGEDQEGSKTVVVPMVSPQVAGLTLRTSF